MLRLLDEEGDHALGVERASAQVGLVGGEKSELAAALGLPGGDPCLPQVTPDLTGGVGIHDVYHPLSPLQACPDVLGEQRPVLLLAAVEQADMAPGADVHYLLQAPERPFGLSFCPGHVLPPAMKADMFWR